MKTKSILHTVGVCLGISLACSAHAFDPGNLVKNGNFKEYYENGLPADWDTFSHPTHLNQIQSTVSVIEDGTDSFLQIFRETPDGGEYGQQVIKLDASANTLYVSLKGRVRELAAGAEDWQYPGIGFGWVLPDDSVREIGPGSWLILKHPSDDWTVLETTLNKPAEAIGLRISFLGAGWTGEAEIAEIIVEPLD